MTFSIPPKLWNMQRPGTKWAKQLYTYERPTPSDGRFVTGNVFMRFLFTCFRIYNRLRWKFVSECQIFASRPKIAQTQIGHRMTQIAAGCTWTQLQKLMWVKKSHSQIWRRLHTCVCTLTVIILIHQTSVVSQPPWS